MPSADFTDSFTEPNLRGQKYRHPTSLATLFECRVGLAAVVCGRNVTGRKHSIGSSGHQFAGRENSSVFRRNGIL